MKLFYADASPYARKARVTVAEKGLDAEIDFVSCNPFDEAASLRAANPLSKVPTLLLNDGAVLYDSPVICEYLDSLAPTPRLYPASGEARWIALRRQALADGVLDAAFAVVVEGRRAEGERSPSWVARWTTAIEHGLDAIEGEVDALPAAIDIAQIGFGAALGYLDLRLPDLAWRARRPRAAAWFSAFAERPSMVATRPAG